MKNKHARRLGKLSWKKHPKTSQRMSEIGKSGWTEERRKKQRLIMQLAREIRMKKYAREEENKIS